MFTQIDDLPAGVVGVVASGRVTADDRQQILEPSIEDTVETAGRVRLLYVAGRTSPATIAAGSMTTRSSAPATSTISTASPSSPTTGPISARCWP